MEIHEHDANFKTVLMCPPTFYTVKYKINPWMNTEKPVDKANAMLQWRNLKNHIEEEGFRILQIFPTNGLPDMVYCSDAGICYNNQVFMGRMRCSERQGEQNHFEQFLRNNNYQILQGDLDSYFEGGDAVFMTDDLLVLASGFRSSPKAADKIQAMGNFKIVKCRLVNDNFYHLNMCFCRLSDHSAIWYPSAFDKESQAALLTALHNAGIELIEIPEADALKLACNALVLGETILMPVGVHKTVAVLEKRGYKVIECDLSEFVKGGGGCSSLVLKL